MILSAKEASAKYFNNHISYWKLLEMVKRKEIPSFTMGSRVFFNTDTLDKWISDKEQGTPEVEPKYGTLRRID